jgi:phenylalanyl-tRNA synthetase alpha chain
MDAILAQIEAHKEEIRSFETTDPELLEAFRIRFLGTKGIVKALMGEMKNVPAESRRDFGQVMNAFKETAEARYAALKDALSVAEA